MWRQPWLETRPDWTNSRASRDTVTGIDGKSYTSDQATIWRWREAFQHDFAARMDWTIKDVAQANHNPDVVVNGVEGKAPLLLEATVGTPIALEANKSRDRDGNALRYSWFFYPEAGTGLPSVGGGSRAPVLRPLPLRAPHPLRVRDGRPAFHPHRQEDGPRRRLSSRSPMARRRSPPSRRMRPALRT